MAVSGIGRRTARVTWEPPAITFLNSLTTLAGYRLVASQTQFNISDVVVDVPPSVTSYTFPSTLEEFTAYQCAVYAKNSFGYGTPSRNMQFTTLQDGKKLVEYGLKLVINVHH